eukprot:TRINITY_DN108531_c0_g1_i1.p1 TRINITY_DN108531_c0_g1~~TRINITY_DN108531_c0_g1_i1.p1  ORF type:complete len:314 (-),score=50.67 TRINITY_DN108531_c0_g1_i1:132-1073(-)
MPNHRKHLDMIAERPASASSSTSSSHGLNDWNDMREFVCDLSKRLEVLEKVFLFVDFEQISQVVDRFAKLQIAPTVKAGSDSALSRQGDDTVAGRTSNEQGVPNLTRSSNNESSKPSKKSKPKSSSHRMPADVKHVSDLQNSSESHQGQAEAVCSKELANMPSKPFPETLQPKQQVSRLQPLSPHTVSPKLLPSNLPPTKHSASVFESQSQERAHETDREVKDLKERVQFGLGLAKAADDMEQRSTSSTWSHTLGAADDMEQRSSSSTWSRTLRSAEIGDADEDGDPVEVERFTNFIKQATRPRWRQPEQGFR